MKFELKNWLIIFQHIFFIVRSIFFIFIIELYKLVNHHHVYIKFYKIFEICYKFEFTCVRRLVRESVQLISRREKDLIFQNVGN